MGQGLWPVSRVFSSRTWSPSISSCCAAPAVEGGGSEGQRFRVTFSCVLTLRLGCAARQSENKRGERKVARGELALRTSGGRDVQAKGSQCPETKVPWSSIVKIEYNSSEDLSSVPQNSHWVIYSCLEMWQLVLTHGHAFMLTHTQFKNKSENRKEA